MSEEKKSTKSFMLGFLAGSAIGAIIALLYAPKSGKETREDLKKRASHLLNEADEYFELAKHKTLDLMNEAKKKSEELITKTKIEAESLLEESEELLSKVKDRSSSNPIDDNDSLSGLDAYKRDKF
jgi:gas vesicle protein